VSFDTEVKYRLAQHQRVVCCIVTHEQVYALGQVFRTDTHMWVWCVRMCLMITRVYTRESTLKNTTLQPVLRLFLKCLKEKYNCVDHPREWYSVYVLISLHSKYASTALRDLLGVDDIVLSNRGGMWWDHVTKEEYRTTRYETQFSDFSECVCTCLVVLKRYALFRRKDHLKASVGFMR
jgi:hypothetical protein